MIIIFFDQILEIHLLFLVQFTLKNQQYFLLIWFIIQLVAVFWTSSTITHKLYITTFFNMSPKIKKSLLSIKDALFYKDPPIRTKKSFLFSSPIKDFTINAYDKTPIFWGVAGPRKSDFLKIVASRYFSDPPLGRSYPYLSKGGVVKNIQFIDFRENSGLDKCHMAARYESFSFKGKLEMSDDVNSVKNFISGANNYNKNNSTQEEGLVEKLLTQFDLKHLENKWINTLSNGQMRRARIAKAVHTKPQLLVIDDPFLGLDPKATHLVSDSLKRVALDLDISLVAGLRTLDEAPNWISKLAIVDDTGLTYTDEMFSANNDIYKKGFKELRRTSSSSTSYELIQIPHPKCETAFIEFKNACVVYKNLPVFLDFNWRVKKGSSWRIIGENGSGKTTLLSLITAEHPQSWRSVLSINGVVRKPGSGVNYFDINNRIGISSPELHAVVPFRMNMYHVILNGLIPDIGNSNFRMFYKNSVLPPYAQSILGHFDLELKHNNEVPFNELSVSLQKLTLFLRAIIKQPEILILDEAFSGMNEDLVAKCHFFIEQNLKDTTILTVGHLDWEVPPHDYVLKLEGDSDRSFNFFTLKKR